MHGNEIIYALICINNHVYHINLACYQGCLLERQRALGGGGHLLGRQRAFQRMGEYPGMRKKFQVRWGVNFGIEGRGGYLSITI